MFHAALVLETAEKVYAVALSTLPKDTISYAWYRYILVMADIIH